MKVLEQVVIDLVLELVADQFERVERRARLRIAAIRREGIVNIAQADDLRQQDVRLLAGEAARVAGPHLSS